jgi:hypothetical protein
MYGLNAVMGRRMPFTRAEGKKRQENRPKGEGIPIMVTELLAYGVYIDGVLLLLIVITLISSIAAQRKTKQKVEETEKRVVALKKYQEDIFESLDKKYASFKEVLVDKTDRLTTRLNELSKKFDSVLENNETVMLEIDNKTQPLKVSLGETEKSLRKLVQANEIEMKKVEKELSDFSREIQKMKDDIRERTIDLEL